MAPALIALHAVPPSETLLFLLLSHLHSSPSPGACQQLSEINFLVSSAPGRAEAWKQSCLVFSSCPRLFFFSARDCVRNLLFLPSELYLRCLLRCVSLEVLGPARRVAAGGCCPPLIRYRDRVDALPVSRCEQHKFAPVSGSCCCRKATWITKGQLVVTEIPTGFIPVFGAWFLCTLHDALTEHLCATVPAQMQW